MVSLCHDAIVACGDNINACLRDQGLAGCDYTGYHPGSLEDLNAPPTPPPSPTPPPKVIERACDIAVADCRATEPFWSCMTSHGCTEPHHVYHHGVTKCTDAEDACAEILRDCLAFLVPELDCHL